MSNKVALLLLFALTSFFANAQQTWSLQQCLDAGLKNSIPVKIKQLEITRSQKLYTNPLLELVPTVSLNGNHNYNFGSTIDPSTNARVSSDIQSDNLYLNANVNLLDFTMLATARKNKIDIAIARADAAVISYEYKLQLLSFYFDALFSQELVKIQVEQLENTTYNLERITKEVQIGSKPQSDLYDIRLAFSQDEKRLMEARQLFDVQKLQLFQLMNVATDKLSEVQLDYILAAPEEDSTVIGSNPKIELAALQYESAQKAIAIQRSVNLPTVSAFYNMSTFYSAPLQGSGAGVTNFGTQLEDNKNHQAGLQVSIPVFTGFRRNRQITASKIEAEKSKWASEQEKNLVKQEIEQEEKLQSQYEQLSVNISNTVQYARESFQTTQSKFLSGKIEAVLYTTVKNQLLASEYDRLKNDLQLQRSRIKLSILRTNGI